MCAIHLCYFIWQVFNAMNSYDLGCSAGGGRDSAQVFTDVGLAFLSDTIKSKVREGKWNLPFALVVCTNHCTSGEADSLKIKSFYHVVVVRTTFPLDFSFPFLPLGDGSSDSPDVGWWSFGTQLTWDQPKLAGVVRCLCKRQVFCEWGWSYHKWPEWSGYYCHSVVTKLFSSAFSGYTCLRATGRQKRSLDFRQKISGIGMFIQLGFLKGYWERGSAGKLSKGHQDSHSPSCCVMWFNLEHVCILCLVTWCIIYQNKPKNKGKDQSG